MSGHALIGRPDARMEMMVLVFMLVYPCICCLLKAMTFFGLVIFLYFM